MSKVQFLLFKLSGDQYAIPLNDSREIVQYSEPTRLPSVPSTVAGVLNLRGRMIAVVSLARRLGVAEVPITSRTCVIVAETTTEPMGFIVDEIDEVMTVDQSQVEPCPSTVTEDCADLITGVIKAENRAIVCLTTRSPRIVS
nr:chemotaxis protein CheW [Bdellovibrio sp. HM001]